MAIKVWYVLVQPDDPPLYQLEEDVRRLGRSLDLESEMEDVEFKDLLRKRHHLSCPILISSIEDNGDGLPIWLMCEKIDYSRNSWYLKVELGEEIPQDQIPAVEECLEQEQWRMERLTRELIELRKKRKILPINFELLYAIAMPGNNLENCPSEEAAMSRKALTRLYFPAVPTIKELKERLKTRSVSKSWPIKYLDRAAGAWVNLPLDDDDRSLSEFGSNKRVVLIIVCPKNMYHYDLPEGVHLDPYCPPTEDELY